MAFASLSLCLVVSNLISINSAFSQTYPPGSGLGTWIEGAISRYAATTGTDLALYPAASYDVAISTAETALADATAGAAGAAAVANPITWAAAGAFAAVGVGAGVYCMTQGCDVSQSIQSGFQWLNAGPLSTPVAYNAPLFSAAQGAAPGTNRVVGSDPAKIGTLSCQDWVAANGFTYVSSYLVPSNGGCYLNYCIFRHVLPTNNSAVLSLCPDNNWKVPTSGLPVGPLFDVGNASSGTLNASEADPADFQPAGSQPFTTYQPPSGTAMSEPVNPATIASIINTVIHNMPSSYAPTASLQSAPPVTSAGVQTLEKDLGYTPTLQDLFTPMASNDLVTVGTTGTAKSSVPVSTSLSTVSGGLSPYTSTATTPPCGNLLAGETPCGVTLDATYNPLTDTWEWMQESPLVPGATVTPVDPSTGKALVPNPNTLPLQQTQTAELAQSQLQDITVTGTQTITDTLTDPSTVIQTLTKTQPLTETKTRDAVTEPPSIPPITLPFNEWPQVIQQFNLAVPPSLSGQCPTVTFYSTTLRSTFTIGAQCLVMDALKPYMAYVLPPTYLFLGLLLLMSA